MDVIGVHRYFVRNGYFIEATMFCPLYAPSEVMDEEKLLASSIADHNAMMSSLKFKGAPDEYLSNLLSSYKSKSRYLSRIVADALEAIK
jgi:hypothetical protein